MGSAGGIHIGTSGWHYKHWKRVFYPVSLSSAEWLAFYADHFQCVEINSSFYRLPGVETFRNWAEMVPADFVFTVKASRYLTHMKKLMDARTGLKKFLECAYGLGSKLGPLLFQLPPRWQCNVERLRVFLAEVPTDVRCVFEFRDTSWFSDQVYQILKDAGAASCIYDLAGQLSPEIVTAGFIYVRLHGPGSAYQGKYQERVLSQWGEKFLVWAAQGKEVFCFFDNDQNGYAAINALELKGIIEKQLRSN